jgi:N-acetylneuraminic acid mutarotase
MRCRPHSGRPAPAPTSARHTTPRIRWRAPLLAPLALAALAAACGSEDGGTWVAPDPCPPNCPPEPVYDGEWSRAASMPLSRREMAAALLDGRIYVPGGISESRTVMSSVAVYDVAADRWSSAPPLPEPRHHHGVAAAGGKLYVIGGYSSLEPYWGPWPVVGTVFEFDPAVGRWETKRPMPLPLAAAAVVGYEGKVYVFGGVSSAEMATGFVYDPAADAWAPLPDMPTAREHVSAVVLGSSIYVLRGRRFQSGNTGAVEAYSPETETWRTLAPLTATSGHGAAVLGDRIYAFGGESLSGGVFDHAQEYDPATDGWRRVEPLPSARHGAPAVGVGDAIHVFGGNGDAGYANLVFRIP